MASELLSHNLIGGDAIRHFLSRNRVAIGAGRGGKSSRDRAEGGFLDPHDVAGFEVERELPPAVRASNSTVAGTTLWVGRGEYGDF